MLVGLLAVARAVASAAEQGLDQSFLSWLWALIGGDAGRLLTQLEAEADGDDAYMICMTEVCVELFNPRVPTVSVAQHPR